VVTHPFLEALDATRRDAWDRQERAVLRHIQQIRTRAQHRSSLGEWIRISSIPEALGCFLFALVRAARPAVCLELGTGAGISTMYLAAALGVNRRGALWALDGNAAFLALAHRHVATLPVEPRCRFIQGRFDQTLVPTLQRLRTIDVAFIDGDHTELATRRQFPQLRRALRRGGILVYDDIRWSPGMRRAWRAIQQQSPAGSTLDCGRFGVVFADARAA